MAVFLVALGAAPGSASAALKPVSCLSYASALPIPGCAGSPASGALSPVLVGGTLVVASGRGLAQFAADAGRLSYAGCAGAPGSGCAVTSPGLGSDFVAHLTAAPDGRSMYALGQSTIVELGLDARGRLRRALGCWRTARAPANGCRLLPRSLSGGLVDVAVTRDGRHLAVASLGLAFFRRAGAGRLTAEGCLAPRPGAGCPRIRSFPAPAALAPLGRVGVAVGGSRGIALAEPGAAWAITDCLAARLAGCRRSAYPTAAATELAAAGSRLFALAAQRGGASALVVLAAVRGRLRPQACIGGSAAPCRPLPAGAVQGAQAVAAAPDGRSVFTAQNRSTVLAFTRSAAGRFALRACVTAGPGDRPTSPPPGCVTAGRGLGAPNGLAAGPRGSLYVTGLSATLGFTFA